MLIGIDARYALRGLRGIGKYTLNLIKNLSRLDLKNKYILYLDRNDDTILPSQPNIEKKILRSQNYFIYEQFILPRQAVRDGIDILHCTGNTAPVFLSEKIKLVLTLHDVMFLLPKEIMPLSKSLYQRLGRIYRSILVNKIVDRAQEVITDSEYSRKEIERRTYIKKEKICKISLGVDSFFRPVAEKELLDSVRIKYNVGSKFILCLGGIEPRKNTTRFIYVLNSLRKEEDVELLIVGLSEKEKKYFMQLIHNLGIYKRVKLTGFVPESDLLLLYNAATLFLNATLFEGFGLPILEAFACGVPVITANRGAAAEIAGDSALLVDPADINSIREAITRLLSDEGLRYNLKKNGLEEVKHFSWEHAAKETLKIYGDIMNTRKR